MAEGDAAQPSQEYLDENSGGLLVGISVGLAMITTVFCGLRLYAKRLKGSSLGLDDVLLGAAYVVNLGMCALGIVAVQLGGVGQHVEAVEMRNPKLFAGWARSILAFEIVYYTSVALPKMAIVALYLRLFNWTGLMRVLALSLMALLALTSLALVIAACFQCRPLAYWWDRTIPGGSCFNIQAFFHAQSVPGLVLDLFIMALPIKTIWGLKLPILKRIALMLIFMVASFGIVASILRASKFFSTSALEDRTWSSVQLVGWSIIETSTYIVTVCLPNLKPLIPPFTLQRLKDKLRKTISAASKSMSTASRSRSRRSVVINMDIPLSNNDWKTSKPSSRDLDHLDSFPAGTKSSGEASLVPRPRSSSGSRSELVRPSDMTDGTIENRTASLYKNGSGTSYSLAEDDLQNHEGTIWVSTEIRMERLKSHTKLRSMEERR